MKYYCLYFYHVSPSTISTTCGMEDRMMQDFDAWHQGELKNGIVTESMTERELWVMYLVQ